MLLLRRARRSKAAEELEAEAAGVIVPGQTTAGEAPLSLPCPPSLFHPASCLLPRPSRTRRLQVGPDGEGGLSSILDG